jgi:nitrate reductase gamma subunit
MNGNYIFSLITVVVLGLLAFFGTTVFGLQYLFGVIVPYACVIWFVFGVLKRMLGWANSPVPFRITTTCGQQKSLPWIKQNRIDNPFTGIETIIRMILEIVLFRSLFRNTKSDITASGKVTYMWEKWLWLGALAFHYSFLVVIVRHMRFFTDPVPYLINMLEYFDSLFKVEFVGEVVGKSLQIGLPGFFISGLVLLAAILFLFSRRVLISQVRYISLPADFFPLFLLMGIAGTGIFMRYFSKVDIISIKELTMGLATFCIPDGAVLAGLSSVFYIHLFLVCILLAYFPFSKLMHMGGIFLSPTRNLPNNSRARRHINPWNYPVKVHTYDEYEDEFREKMIEAGLPVEKES